MCNQCGSFFKRTNELRDYVFTAHEGGLYKCHECHESHGFKSKSALQNHIRNKHSKQFLHKCRFCDFGKDDRRDVSDHELRKHEHRLSAEEKAELHERSKCKRCDKSYYNQRYLKEHIKTCSKAKSLSCPKCQKKYKHNKILQAHIANCKK